MKFFVRENSNACSTFSDVWDTHHMLPCMLKSTYHCGQTPLQRRTAGQVLIAIIRFASGADFDLHPECDFQSSPRQIAVW